MNRVIFKNIITRKMLRQHPNWIFLFGDNLEKRGYGGQAKVMRGEPNAIGIPTKKRPSMKRDSFFTDDEFEENKKAIDKAIAEIPKDKIIVMPIRGLGTGRAMLRVKAPKTWQYVCDKIKELQKEMVKE